MSKSPEEKRAGAKKPTESKKSSEKKSSDRVSSGRGGPDAIEGDRRGGPDLDPRGRGRRGARRSPGRFDEAEGGRGRGGPFDGPEGGRGGHGGHGRHGGGRGRGGPRAKRGEVRNAVISLLAEGPKHGYQLIQEMGERSGGVWAPSPGSVYPILHRLAEAGVVEADDLEDGRRIFRLTTTGRLVAERLHPDGDVPWTIGQGESDEVRVLREHAVQFDSAVSQVAQVATTDQLVRATAIVAESRRRLYALLAEDPSSPASDPTAS